MASTHNAQTFNNCWHLETASSTMNSPFAKDFDPMMGHKETAASTMTSPFSGEDGDDFIQG